MSDGRPPPTHGFHGDDTGSTVTSDLLVGGGVKASLVITTTPPTGVHVTTFALPRPHSGRLPLIDVCVWVCVCTCVSELFWGKCVSASC